MTGIHWLWLGIFVACLIVAGAAWYAGGEYNGVTKAALLRPVDDVVHIRLFALGAFGLSIVLYVAFWLVTRVDPSPRMDLIPIDDLWPG